MGVSTKNGDDMVEVNAMIVKTHNKKQKLDLAKFNHKCYQYSSFYNPQDVFGEKIIHTMSNNRVAEILLTIQNAHQYYVGYLVSIIDFNIGNLNTHLFKFNDYFDVRMLRNNHGYTLISYLEYDDNFWDNPPSTQELKDFWYEIERYITRFE